VDLEEARERMADVRRRLEAFDPEHIYNMDESGLF